jgi:choline kinase
MKAVILAAGVGRRLGGADSIPKSMLEFGGKSLLRRHLDVLNRSGIRDITVVTGHRSDVIEAEIARVQSDAIQTCRNPRYREGSIVSLWTARDILKGGDPVVVMDADVLYDSRIMRALLSPALDNGFLLDRDVEPGEEPMKLCVRAGFIVDLHKRPTAPHDWYGETVGFTRLSASMAAKLAERTEMFVRDGRTNVEYEEAIRELIIEEPGSFGYVEITGLPWIEIDFERDVARARDIVLPQLVDD